MPLPAVAGIGTNVWSPPHVDGAASLSVVSAIFLAGLAINFALLSVWGVRRLFLEKPPTVLQVSVISRKAAGSLRSVGFDWPLLYPVVESRGRIVEPVAACSCLFNWSSSKTHARLNAPVIPFAFCSPSSLRRL